MENVKKTTTSTAETVTISCAEYDELKSQNQWLLEQLGLSRKRQFGVSSEKPQEEIVEQMVMTFGLTFNEAEADAYGTKSAAAEQISVKAHTRKRQSGSVEDVVPEGTPTEVVEHRLAGEKRICSACGAVMEEIGKEIRRGLKMEPARFWIQEDVYYTYACMNCEQETGEANIVKTPKEPVICPLCFPRSGSPHHDPEVCDVFAFVPSEFGRQGLKLSRQTMSNWILNTP